MLLFECGPPSPPVLASKALFSKPALLQPRARKNQFFRSIAVALLALFFIQTSFATCGGGGGGGGGGMSNNGGGGAKPPRFGVPWEARQPQDAPAVGVGPYLVAASHAAADQFSPCQSHARVL